MRELIGAENWPLNLAVSAFTILVCLSLWLFTMYYVIVQIFSLDQKGAAKQHKLPLQGESHKLLPLFPTTLLQFSRNNRRAQGTSKGEGDSGPKEKGGIMTSIL